MVKILSDLPPDPFDSWFTVIGHDGPAEPWDPEAVHYVWWYYAADIPPGVQAAHIHTDEAPAVLEARAWVAMPMIPRFLCAICRAYALGPTQPRWNIYRAQNRLIVPRTILFDWSGA